MTETASQPIVGVLALQGAFEAHARVLRPLGAQAVLIRTPDQLVASDGTPKVDGLIMPGGESTTMLKSLERGGFFDVLRGFVCSTPTFGTCAGCILMAHEVRNPSQRSLDVLDIAVERNAYGRQNESAILTEPTTLPGGPLEMVFIRAPRIIHTGPEVETLASRDGFPTLVQQGHLMAATFHPELGHDPRVHQHFLGLIRTRR